MAATKLSTRLDKYFEKYLKDFAFFEMKGEALAKIGGEETLAGIEIPIRAEDLAKALAGEGISLAYIAEAMAVVIGACAKFKYDDQYLAFFDKVFAGNSHIAICETGKKYAGSGDLERACLYFRASLKAQPSYIEALYSYAMCLREIYLSGSEEEFVGNFKAEAIKYFELCTEVDKDFAPPLYYLGYAYLNLGLYTKASLVWKEFLQVAQDEEQTKEIAERLEQLKEPVKIETGINEVLAGRYDNGIFLLNGFTSGNFEMWWPLHYYLGVAYFACEDKERAIDEFKRVLQINPSHIDSMEELAKIYEEAGDVQNAQKYAKKAKLLKDYARETDDR